MKVRAPASACRLGTEIMPCRAAIVQAMYEISFWNNYL
jgi:hypothetical protein